MNDFKDRLIAKSKELVLKIDHCAQEENTKQFLITPFLAFLGYDIFNPQEVMLEHRSDFSEKYQNKVDYAIFVDGHPVMAIEAKPVNTLKSDHRGQLKSYFNAQKSIKLAILTDGIIYECYTDSDAPNMMDDSPFLRFSLLEISQQNIDESTLEGLVSLTKPMFNPENVGAQAKRKLFLRDLTNLLDKWSQDPKEDIIRIMLENIGDNRKKTAKYIEDNAPLIKQAFDAFIDSRILARVGFADASIVKLPEPQTETAIDESKGIQTTDGELKIFDYCKRRLAYLVKDENKFNAVASLEYKDYKGFFRLYYKMIERGALLNFTELKDNQFSFVFPKLDKRTIVTSKLSDIDESLLESFNKCLEDIAREAA